MFSYLHVYPGPIGTERKWSKCPIKLLGSVSSVFRETKTFFGMHGRLSMLRFSTSIIVPMFPEEYGIIMSIIFRSAITSWIAVITVKNRGYFMALLAVRGHRKFVTNKLPYIYIYIFCKFVNEHIACINTRPQYIMCLSSYNILYMPAI